MSLHQHYRCPFWMLLFAAMWMPAAALQAAPQWTWLTPGRSYDWTPHPSVARVIVKEKGNASSLGSGTLVGATASHGLVVTNWHVVRGGGPVTVVFPDGFRSPARVLKSDETWDLAALLIPRPKSAAVRLARRAPKPGDTLTIAGYGSGRYRAATGTCTQYVAPGSRQPFEMVEVSVQARQGDSGGPIFNADGELAGVLFGAGRGTTSGSYSGRVSRFLQSTGPTVAAIMRDSSSPPPQATATARLPDEACRSLPQGGRLRQPSASMSGNPMPRSSVPRSPMPADHTGTNSEGWSPGDVTQRFAEAQKPSVTPAHNATTPHLNQPRLEQPPADTPLWDELVGRSPWEKLKSIMAAIGLLAILVHLAGRLHG